MQIIFHIDMDAFYASIEQRDDPSLKGKPVVVGSPPDKRGVVCTASYEARVYGIHSALPSRTAYARCPQAVFLRPRMDQYASVSQQLMAIFRRFSPKLEKLSIDEAFLAMDSSCRTLDESLAVAGRLKQAIQRELALTASLGVGPNKFLAKLASDLEKPDGLTVAPFAADEIKAFLAPLPVGRIWGVGNVTATRLQAANLSTIGDIQRMGRDYLSALFGANFADHLWRLAHGLDDRPVVDETEEKSLSNEETFGIDCADPNEVCRVLIFLAEKVGGRLRKAGKLARTAQIKVRFGDFRTLTRQRRFRDATDSDRYLVAAASELFSALAVDQPVRLIGFGVHQLSAAKGALRQPSLFDDSSVARQAERSRLDRAIDQLRERYGEGVITRGMKPQRSD